MSAAGEADRPGRGSLALVTGATSGIGKQSPTSYWPRDSPCTSARATRSGDEPQWTNSTATPGCSSST